MPYCNMQFWVCEWQLNLSLAVFPWQRSVKMAVRTEAAVLDPTAVPVSTASLAPSAREVGPQLFNMTCFEVQPLLCGVENVFVDKQCRSAVMYVQ